MSANRLTRPKQTMKRMADRRSAAETEPVAESVNQHSQRLEHGEHPENEERGGSDVANDTWAHAIRNPPLHSSAQKAGERTFGDHRQDGAKPDQQRRLPQRCGGGRLAG